MSNTPIDTVLVLGGGGGRGAAQLGILRALAERGIQPDACVGTSVGALNSAVVASHPLPEAVRLLEEIWASRQTRAVFRSDMARMAYNRVRRRPYLRSDAPIRALVEFSLDIIGRTSFEEMDRPLSIILTDLMSGEPVVVSQGRLRDAMRASCAVPGMYPPVRLGDRMYVDGGVTENCSLSTAAAMNPGHIIAVDLSADEPAPMRRFGDVLERVIAVAQHARVVADFDRFSSRLPVTLICPRLPRRAPRFADFAAVRDAAWEGMETLLQTIAQKGGGLSPGVFYLPIPAEKTAAG